MAEENLGITWTNLYYHVQNSKLSQMWSKVAGSNKSEYAVILRGASGHVKSGQMMAVMGASGSGKSILMGMLLINTTHLIHLLTQNA